MVVILVDGTNTCTKVFLKDDSTMYCCCADTDLVTWL